MFVVTRRMAGRELGIYGCARNSGRAGATSFALRLRDGWERACIENHLCLSL